LVTIASKMPARLAAAPGKKAERKGMPLSFNTTRKQVNNKAKLASIAYGYLSEHRSRCGVWRGQSVNLNCRVAANQTSHW
jgi:hypothetical protein